MSTRIVTSSTARPELPVYIVPDTQLAMGVSLGNSAIWVNTKGTGAIERVFNARVGESLFGAVCVRYGLMGTSFDDARHQPEATVAVPLSPDGDGSVELHPAYQRRRFTIAAKIRVSETTFVPLQDMDAPDGDVPAAYVMVEMTNGGPAEHAVRVIGFARLRGTLSADVHAHYDSPAETLVASNSTRQRATRCFGTTGTTARYATTADFGCVYDPTHLPA